MFAAAALLSGAMTTGIARGETSSTLFGAATPVVASDPDTGKVELGVRFKPAVNGQVTSMRFYKGVKNIGAHIGSLWSGASRLATATFRNETIIGWQAAKFDKPVGVLAGQVYTASYVAPVKHYSVDNPYSFPKVSTNLTALGGVYKYRGGYPTDAHQKSNYWVDVMFSATALTSTKATSTSSAPSAGTRTSAIVTPISSVSSSATSSSTPRWNIGFPYSLNTGVPAGTVLKTVRNGDSGAGWHVERDIFYVDRASTVIDGLRIPFVLKVMADDVVVRNSAVAAASYYTVNVSDPPRYYSRLTIVDSDIDGGSNAASQSMAVMAAAGSTFSS